MSQFGTKVKSICLKSALATLIFMAQTDFAWAEREPASIDSAAAVVKPSSIFHSDSGTTLSPELISAYQYVKSQEKAFDMAQVIPLSLQPTDNSSQVFSQIADKTAGVIFNSPAVRASSLGRTATDVEQKMKQEVVLSDGSPDSVKQKLNFNVQAFQTTARLDYTGYTHAAVKYQASASTLGFEVSEKVSGNKDLVVSHDIKPDDRLSQVSLRWTF